MQDKPTVRELEDLLDDEDPGKVTVMPDGSVVVDKTITDQAATIARLEAELDAMTDERDQMFAKAVVDPGSNHIVGWKQVAEEAQAYNVRLEAERDEAKIDALNFRAIADESIKELEKAEAHNAAMRTALGLVVNKGDILTDAECDTVRQALAPDAGQPFLDVVNAARDEVLLHNNSTWCRLVEAVAALEPTAQ